MYAILTAMATYSSREIIVLLRADGWYEVAQEGSHRQFKHPTKAGRVTVKDPQKDIPAGTARSIFRQAGLNWRARRR